jgi:hypothetical protein
MKHVALRVVAAALLPAAVLILASCSDSSKPPKPTADTKRTTHMEPGVPGGVVVETHTITANILHIDAASREVLLAIPDGKRERVKCGPEIVNFDQLRVGSQVKITVAEQLVVQMATESATSTSGEATVVALAPKGAKPGGFMANTVQVVATVAAIDLANHKATLQFPDGTTQTVAVRPDVDLTKRKVGEKVVIRTTEAWAISVEKP